MKRKLLISVMLLLIIAVLARGAYTAVQLLSIPETDTAEAAGGGGRVMQSMQVVNGGAPVSVKTTILPSDDLPDEQSAAFGIVLSRQDDTLIVGTGDIDLAVEVDVDGNTGQENVSVVPTTNGPELEVVLTRNTTLYRDVTDVTGQIPDESGEITIKQEIRPVTDSSEIKEQMEIEIWGTRSGDRIVAELIVFGPLAGGAFE